MTSVESNYQKHGLIGAVSSEKPKYSFVVEWYDPVAQIVKKFLMSYYSLDGTVELYDLKNHRIFLRRCKQDGIELENLYVSATVTIMSRQIRIVDYADTLTKCKFEVEFSHTFCMVKPDVVSKLGEIISFMTEHGFKIIKMKMGIMSNECATDFYKEHEGKSFLRNLLAFMQSGASVAMSALAENAVSRWRDLIGPMDSEEAKKVAPQSLRAIYGTDVAKNGVHGSRDEEHAFFETEIWFPTKAAAKTDYIKSTCIGKNTTCCIVKPHAILEGNLGPIIKYINEKEFKVTALEMFMLDVSTAEEFLEVYKGVVPEYSAMVVQLTSGPCVGMEIMDIKNPECSQETFRKLCGPTDPVSLENFAPLCITEIPREIAQKLRPDTIRAKFGKTKVMNAVHCTDLPDDAVLEVEYFFKVLQI